MVGFAYKNAAGAHVFLKVFWLLITTHSLMLSFCFLDSLQVGPDFPQEKLTFEEKKENGCYPLDSLPPGRFAGKTEAKMRDLWVKHDIYWFSSHFTCTCRLSSFSLIPVVYCCNVLVRLDILFNRSHGSHSLYPILSSDSRGMVVASFMLTLQC